jgi:EpsI family protein
VVVLVCTWGFLQSRSQAEPPLERKAFGEFPLTIAGRWQGVDHGMEDNILKVLKVTDYMMRTYAPKPGVGEAGRDGRPTRSHVGLYVGYYQSQRTGATYHSPKNCLPGAGWQFAETGQVTVTVPGKGPITINKVLIEKGLDKQMILYWYQDRGRIIASEYWAKAYLVWDAMTRNRTDGTLVRITVPVVGSSEQAFAVGLQFLEEFLPLLDGYLPV